MRYSMLFYIVVTLLCTILFPLYRISSQEYQFLGEKEGMSSVKVNNLISEYTLSHDNASNTLFADMIALLEYELNDKNYSDYADNKLYQWFCEDSVIMAQIPIYQDKIGLNQVEKEDLYSRVISPISKKTMAEQSAERLNCYFLKSQNNIDSLLIYLLDYYSYGYHYEGFSEYISQGMQELFYRNDTIGKYFDLYMTKHDLPQDYQDTIRVRMMFDIVCHLLLLTEENADNPPPVDEVYQLPPKDYMDYPYFNSHNNILNNLSLYQDYY